MRRNYFRTPEEIEEFVDSLEVVRGDESYEDAAERLGPDHPYYGLLLELQVWYEDLKQQFDRMPPDYPKGN